MLIMDLNMDTSLRQVMPESTQQTITTAMCVYSFVRPATGYLFLIDLVHWLESLFRLE